MARDYANLQRAPFLTPIWLSILTAAVVVGCLCFLAWAGWLWATADSTTVIVVRHAESAAGEADPPLDSVGVIRAERLARMLGATGTGAVEAIYASPSRRSRMTAAPLGARLHLAPIVSVASERSEGRSWIHRIVREHSGGRILIIGENDIIPEIVKGSGGIGEIPPMPDDDYGTMYIVAVPRIGRPNVLRLTY